MILVDSNVIIDIVTQGQEWSAWSERAFADAAERAPIMINPLIYEEISIKYATPEDLDAVLDDLDVLRAPLPYAAGFLAGRAYLDYRRRGGVRTSPMPDFYIGAHAAVSGLALLTRDAQRYASYFPTVRLIAPDA